MQKSKVDVSMLVAFGGIRVGKEIRRAIATILVIYAEVKKTISSRSVSGPKRQAIFPCHSTKAPVADRRRSLFSSQLLSSTSSFILFPLSPPSAMFKLARTRPFTAALRAATEPSMRTRIAQQQRNLSIHEYLSANLLKSYGVGVPKGEVARSAEEAEAVAKSLGNDDMVIKAQVLAGGRGKGHFDNGLKGGVRVIYSPTEAKMFAGQMIGQKLITKQTGAAGRLCNSVYIVERKFARREFYLAVLMDRQTQSPVIVASSQGGMDIEAVAKENPEAIITTPIDIKVGVTDAIATKIATELGFSEQCVDEARQTIQNLYRAFMDTDATQIEINPLSETSDHQVLAMDAKLSFDDNAEFRQKEIFSWRDTTQEDADEVKAAEHGLNFIKLDGDIGCLVNGAGLAMATMDIIKLNGGSPANFLDVGGGATPAAIKTAFELITSDPKVSAIFVNIFGGIVRCDAIAQGLINVVHEMDLRTPIIARLQGTNMEQAHKSTNPASRSSQLRISRVLRKSPFSSARLSRWPARSTWVSNSLLVSKLRVDFSFVMSTVRLLHLSFLVKRVLRRN
ncbi:Putative Glutathione synthetase ATP-binding protein [Aspergillus calidoustus]|uniref:Succinate--CoA ligase [ADP-forming] subunit beta, mitochondrial n=1 Tax=Aspergillus calidoustus TaxID=454130 RepID=A0A0U5FSX2_ASPCI|nr:Putative Glutathione synthetase ATP-binding protein [Aspergillus calidoustus]